MGESPRIGRARSDADQIERESLLRDAGDIACLRDPEAVLSLLGRLLIQHVPGDVFAAFVPDLVANEVRVAGQSGPQDRKHPLCEPTRLSEARQLLAKTIAGRRYLAASTRNSSPLGRVLFSFGVGCGLLLELRSGEGSNGWPLIARESPTTPFDAPSTNRALGLVRLAVAALDNSRRVHQLREKADTASSFVANLSHELRTPLHVIMGYAEMLNDGELGPHTQAQHDLTQRIGASAREQLELVNTALEISRYERMAEIPVAQMVTVDLPKFLAELEAELTLGRSKKGVRVRWTNSVDTPVRTEPVKLKMILKNLVDNAIKFTHEGTVDIVVRQDDADFVFEVRDTGVGIAAASQESIFSAFYQIDPGQGAAGGVGLGLYLVRKLAQALRGEIKVESQPGRGSTFQVRLPRG